MSTLLITLEKRDAAYMPGERLSGAVSWMLDEPPGAMEVRLFWYTEGKGTRDMEIVDIVPIPANHAQGESSFEFTLPEVPYSCSGTLVSIIWAVEFVAQPGDHSVLQEIVVSPTGREVFLKAVR